MAEEEIIEIKDLVERTGLTKSAINSYLYRKLVPKEFIIGKGRTRRFKESAVAYLLAAGALSQDTKFERGEVDSILNEKKITPQTLAEKIKTLPFPEFIKFLRRQKAEIEETPYLDKWLSV